MAATTPPDPGGADLASRLVRAMGISGAQSVTGGQRIEQADTVASAKLRVLYVAVAAILLAL